MGACIKEFVIVNNYGNFFTGDNLQDHSFSASKTYSGAGGPAYIDIVNVISGANKVCLKPGDTVTTTITRGGTSGSQGTIGSQSTPESQGTPGSQGTPRSNGDTRSNSNGNTRGREDCSGIMGLIQLAPNTDDTDTIGG